MGDFKQSCNLTADILDVKQRCFDKINFRSFAYHKSTGTGFADLVTAEIKASWDAIQTAVDPDTLNVMPQTSSNGNITDSEAITAGTDGGYDTSAGVAEVQGATNPKIDFDFKFMTANNNKLVNKLNTISQNEGVSIFLLDPTNNLVWGYLNTDGSIAGIPIIQNTLYISSGGSESGGNTTKHFSGAIPQDYDEKIVSFTIADMTVQELLNSQAV